MKRWRKDSKLPPGPKRIPILGSLPFLTRKKGFWDWALDHAVTQHEISRVDIGPKSLFIINDLKLVKQLFDKPEFSGRNPTKILLEHRFFNGKSQGVIQTQNKQWETQRRFSLKTLKDFGFGKSSIDDLIHLEAEELIQDFLQVKGDFLLGTDFNVPIINVLWQIIADSRFNKNDPESMKIIKMVTALFEAGTKINFFPFFVLKMFPHWTGYGEKSKIYETVRNYLMDISKDHRKSYDPDHPRDYIDVYLTEIAKNKTGDEFNMEELASCMFDFFLAGTETSSTTLKWSILYLTLHQDVQQRCRYEILKTLGTSNASVSNMIDLPYTCATIQEIQRISRVGPMSLPHSTTCPTRVGQFSFPEKSMFFANLSFIMNDPQHFDRPNEFNPSRFIGLDGRYVKNENVIPFGVGKRYCMGELLARNQIFLFIVSLLQNIQFDLPQDNPPPDPLNYLASLTRIPDHFYVKMSKI